MADYAVHGKKGTGKSKFAAYLMRQAAGQGRRIAANFPVNLDALLPGFHRVAFTQLPDRPKYKDFEALGCGNDDYDEEKNGVLILDELSVWLNSRAFQDKGRDELLHWSVHTRKLGWDVYWLCQNPLQIDRQVREALLEYSVRMKKLDQVRLPFAGYLMQLVGLRGTFPKGTHSAVIRLGFDHDSPLVDRKIFKGDDLHAAYDTRYIFRENPDQCVTTWLGPRYFQPLPARAMSARQKIAAAFGLKGSSALSGRASSQPARTWPSSVMALSPDHRWEVARKLFSASPSASRNVIQFQRRIANPYDSARVSAGDVAA